MKIRFKLNIQMVLSFSSFTAAFFAYLYAYFPQEINPDSRNIPNTPQEKLRDAYDYIIIGGGTAGCVLANRLSEDSSKTVMVIEAGGDTNAIANNPLLFKAVYNTDLDWNYTSISTSGPFCKSNGGECPYPRGRVLGGTSAIDDLLYIRGNRKDYDAWEQMGNDGWNFKSILTYFKKLESYKMSPLSSSGYHGTAGPWPIDYPRYQTNLREEYITAGREFGWKQRDYNGRQQSGIDYSQLLLDGPVGTNAARAYLSGIARKRRNLNIIKRSLVTRILLNENHNQAIGVEYLRNGKKFTIKNKGDVILTAGSINSAKILLLSGVGPEDDLSRIGISTKCNLPVGVSFQDHPAVELMFEISQRLTITTNIWRMNQTIASFARDKEGPLTTTGEEANAFFNPMNTADSPNVGLRLFSGTPRLSLNRTENRPLVTARVVLLKPKSTGSVTLRSRNVFDLPVINGNYLAAESDRIILEEGIKTAIAFMKTPTMRKHSARLYTGYQPECAGRTSRDFIRCLIQYYSFGLSHGVGTLKMGPPNDDNAVVDSKRLLVKCLRNVRVVDGSVIPQMTRGQTTVAVLALAEKAADIIRGDKKNTHYLLSSPHGSSHTTPSPSYASGSSSPETDSSSNPFQIEDYSQSFLEALKVIMNYVQGSS